MKKINFKLKRIWQKYQISIESGKFRFLIPTLLFIFFFFLYAMSQNDRVDDSVFVYFPAIWAFPKQFMYHTAFAIPYHILYGPSVLLINIIYNIFTYNDALFLETAYLQSVFYASMGVVVFYLFLQETKRSLFTSVLIPVFLGFSYVYWSHARMFTTGAIIFFGTILGLYALIYTINRNFSPKATIFAGIMFSLAYFFAQSVLLAIPISFVYALNKIRPKKDIIFGFVSFGILFGILTFPILLLLYKFVWHYPDFSNFFSRVYGTEMGFKMSFEPFLLIKFFKEIINDVTIAIFGIHPLLFVNTLVLYLVLILTVIRKKSDGIIQSMSFYYLLLFVLTPALNRNHIAWLKYWILFLVPVLCILSVALDDLRINIRNSGKKVAPFVFGLVILFLFILRADLFDEQLPQVWGFRPVGRGILPETEKKFYSFIKSEIPTNSLILHEREYYYGNFIAFTQRYSRRLDYAMKNELLTKGDDLFSPSQEKPVFLISPLEASNIYVFEKNMNSYFIFSFIKDISIFDGYQMKLYRFSNMIKQQDSLVRKTLSFYIKIPSTTPNQDWLPLTSGIINKNLYIVIAPNFFIENDNNIYSLPKEFNTLTYPARITGL